MSHRADDIITEVDGQPANVTRLEAAELKRRNQVREEMDRHAREMDRIAIEFAKEMRVA